MERMGIRPGTRTVGDFLDPDDEDMDSVLVPDKVLAKHAAVLDIIRGDSTVSCCFTSGYQR